jgi:anaerobic sulfite reductase subunit B
MATVTAAERGRGRGAMTPLPFRVRDRLRETADTWTLELEPLAEPVLPRPGQFTMLYAFGVGEVPISTSGAPAGDGLLRHTVRAVGPVTRALVGVEPGGVVGVRGPFGTTWPLDDAAGGDLAVVAGGIGLAPLRPAVLHALAQRERYGAVCVLMGARSPAELLYADQLQDWRARFDLDVTVAVDTALAGWYGRVGFVAQLVPGAAFDPARTTALVCGPEIMMTTSARALLERGMPRERIYVSMERNMQCGVGHCGHCQLGPMLICRDGPVFRYDEVQRLMEVPEL